jgi:hypothetical protein
MRSPRTILLFLAVCLLVVGCSSTRLGYSTLPTLVAWRIDRDLALDDDQRLLVRDRLNALHRWHRTNELPRYAELLGRVAAIEIPVSQDAVAGWRAALTEAWQPLAQRAAPDLAALALTLRESQIAHLSRRLADSNDALRGDWGFDQAGGQGATGPKDPVVEARVERFRERSEFFLGDLGGYQLALLRQLASAQPRFEVDWLAEREARQRGLLDLLRRISGERPPPDVAEAWARDWLMGLWRSGDPQRAARLAAAADASDRLTAAMLNMASPRQRDHMVGRLRGWVQDFETLASR